MSGNKESPSKLNEQNITKIRDFTKCDGAILTFFRFDKDAFFSLLICLNSKFLTVNIKSTRKLLTIKL